MWSGYQTVAVNSTLPGLVKGDNDMITLVPYDRAYLEHSWRWLSDPEIRQLTMTPPFTREEQLAFFESLPTRSGYSIWGVAHDGAPIGAAGLKNQREGIAEYWTYIGERESWGKGYGRQIFQAVALQAREKGLTCLEMKVTRENTRSIALHAQLGFVLDQATAGKDILRMETRSF